MPRFFLIILIFHAINTSLFSQSKIDSLQNVLGSIEDDSVKVLVYLKLYYQFHRLDQSIALAYTVKAEELSEKIGLESSKAQAKYHKASVLSDMGLFEEAKKELNSAIAIFYKKNNKEKIVTLKIELALLSQRQLKIEEALKLYLEALPMAQEIETRYAEAKIYNYLGTLYKAQKQYAKAIENYELALSIVKKINFIPGISACLANLGAIHNLVENYDKALSYNEEALKFKRENGDKLGSSRVLNNLGVIYNNLERFGKAEDNFIVARKLAKEVGDTKLVTSIEYGLTVSAFKKGNFKESISMANNILTILDSLPNLEIAVKVYRRLSLAYGELGEFEKAFANATTHNILSDSLYSANILTVTNNLEAKYQNEQKAKEIAMLESENDLQVLQIQKGENERNYLIAFAVTILLLMGLVYNQYRVKQKANAKLKELDQLKSDFFANISHEFRTPLSLIMAPLKDKIDQSKNRQEREEYDMMYRNADRLFNLINQLLDLSKLEGGKLKLDKSIVEISPFFRIITASFGSLAEYKKVDFQSEITEKQTMLEFDQDIIQKVCYNLLSNAFKFTSKGGKVNFKVDFNQNKLRIAVSDTGVGIPVNEKGRVFDRFYQSSNVKQPGTGIGLALTRELVQFHQGEIKLESQTGVGSTFTIEIPVKRIDTSEKTNVLIDLKIPQENLSNQDIEELEAVENGPVILIIEDNPDLRHYLSELLNENYTIYKTENGASGVKKAKEIIPDLIISDVMMPEKDGMEVCNELKEATETNHIPIILLTARADQESKLEGLEKGADDYLLKPFDPKELRVRISNLLDQRSKLKEKYSKLLLLDANEIELSNVDEVFLKSSMEVVKNHIGDSTFSAEQFCLEIGMSRMQLHRKLKALTDLSATAFVRHQRMIRASQLLEAGESVSHAAYATGFESLSYFSRAFKEEYGVVPSEYLPANV